MKSAGVVGGALEADSEVAGTGGEITMGTKSGVAAGQRDGVKEGEGEGEGTDSSGGGRQQAVGSRGRK